MSLTNVALLNNNPIWDRHTRAGGESADIGGLFILLVNPAASGSTLTLQNTNDAVAFPNHGIDVEQGGSFQVALGTGCRLRVVGAAGTTFTIVCFY